MFDAQKLTLSGAEWDVLWCLFYNGPTWDGNIPSKAGRNDLVDRGLVVRGGDGFQALTTEGFEAALAAGMAMKKGTKPR